MVKNRVGVSLVAYNMSEDYIVKLSNSLDLCDLVYKVVVDNSPTNKSKKDFENKNWSYIHKPENIGFGAAHNLAYSLFSQNSNYHLVINPDVYFFEDIIKYLVKFMEVNDNAGAVTPSIYYPDGSFQRLQSRFSISSTKK